MCISQCVHVIFMCALIYCDTRLTVELCTRFSMSGQQFAMIGEELSPHFSEYVDHRVQMGEMMAQLGRPLQSVRTIVMSLERWRRSVIVPMSTMISRIATSEYLETFLLWRRSALLTSWEPWLEDYIAEEELRTHGERRPYNVQRQFWRTQIVWQCAMNSTTSVELSERLLHISTRHLGWGFPFPGFGDRGEVVKKSKRRLLTKVSV
eukprot:Blabericola_migrator_1__4131@NODE_225_length_11139_cov_51_682262_g191_i0_p6_GENE_NODE_225_length_11139_cov_51_682262_g191_i0NODE_225_length_11139_cov_51_682262_g191_i0_p6_ORF_typecomplete_len207_score20_76_NODE_225_length_11139_cov_51_682262_g191_i048415461